MTPYQERVEDPFFHRGANRPEGRPTLMGLARLHQVLSERTSS